MQDQIPFLKCIELCSKIRLFLNLQIPLKVHNWFIFGEDCIRKNAGKNQFQDFLWRTRISTPPKNWNLSLEEDDVNRLWFDHKKRQINIRHMTFLRPLKCIVKSKSVWTAGLKRAVSIVRTIMQNLQNFHYYCKSPVFAYTSCLVNIGYEKCQLIEN